MVELNGDEIVAFEAFCKRWQQWEPHRASNPVMESEIIDALGWERPRALEALVGLTNNQLLGRTLAFNGDGSEGAYMFTEKGWRYAIGEGLISP